MSHRDWLRLAVLVGVIVGVWFGWPFVIGWAGAVVVLTVWERVVLLAWERRHG